MLLKGMAGRVLLPPGRDEIWDEIGDKKEAGPGLACLVWEGDSQGPLGRASEGRRWGRQVSLVLSPFSVLQHSIQAQGRLSSPS